MQFILNIVMRKEFMNIWGKNGNIRENGMYDFVFGADFKNLFDFLKR